MQTRGYFFLFSWLKKITGIAGPFLEKSGPFESKVEMCRAVW